MDFAMSHDTAARGGPYLAGDQRSKKKRKRSGSKQHKAKRSWRKARKRFWDGFMSEAHRVAPRAGVRLCRFLYRIIGGLLWCSAAWVLLSIGVSPETLIYLALSLGTG